MKRALRTTLVLLFAVAVYFRFARHDALKYYFLFGAAAESLGVYLFRDRKNIV